MAYLPNAAENLLPAGIRPVHSRLSSGTAAAESRPVAGDHRAAGASGGGGRGLWQRQPVRAGVPAAVWGFTGSVPPDQWLTQNVRLGHFWCENGLIWKKPISIIIRQNRQGGRAQDAPPPLGTKCRRKAYETPSLLGVGYAVLHGYDNSDRSQRTLSRWAFA